jgi:hypothetical protein
MFKEEQDGAQKLSMTLGKCCFRETLDKLSRNSWRNRTLFSSSKALNVARGPTKKSATLEIGMG